jgi:methionyl-tRNA formyltransferase
MANIYLAGSGSFGLAAAERLTADGHVIVGVCSPSEGRNQAKVDLLAAWAERLDYNWVDVKTLKEQNVPDGTDLIMTAHSHAFIGVRTRARAKYALGYHPSLLPLHRGRDAVRWQSRLNERVVGGTIYHLSNRVDGGPVALQSHLIVPPGLGASRLWRDHLFPLGIELISQAAACVDKDSVPLRPQDEKLATWEPSFDSEPLYRPELLEIGGR